jgi:hypothetical protein
MEKDLLDDIWLTYRYLKPNIDFHEFFANGPKVALRHQGMRADISLVKICSEER